LVNVGQKPITKRILQGSMHYLTAKSKFVYFQMRSPHDGNVEQSHTLQIFSQEGLSNDKKIGWMSNSRRRSGVIFTLFAGIYWRYTWRRICKLRVKLHEHHNKDSGSFIHAKHKNMRCDLQCVAFIYGFFCLIPSDSFLTIKQGVQCTNAFRRFFHGRSYTYMYDFRKPCPMSIIKFFF
jgi:hypothetical protein